MKFDEKELEIIGEYNMPGIYGAPDSIVPKYNRPITPKENMLRMLIGSHLRITRKSADKGSDSSCPNFQY